MRTFWVIPPFYDPHHKTKTFLIVPLPFEIQKMILTFLPFRLLFFFVPNNCHYYCFTFLYMYYIFCLKDLENIFFGCRYVWRYNQQQQQIKITLARLRIYIYKIVCVLVFNTLYIYFANTLLCFILLYYIQ